MQGVPLRVELGMKDVEKQSVVSARRDTGTKETIAFADVASRVPALLEQIQVSLPLMCRGIDQLRLHVTFTSPSRLCVARVVWMPGKVGGVTG